MRLETTQQTLMKQVLQEDLPLPPTWGREMEAGLAVYRNGYRSRLIDALSEAFPKTRQWVAEESFDRAAAHHLICHPPHHWSLDLAGDGFPDTLAKLFGNDPEVPELAQLEWDMQLAFVAADVEPLDAAGFVAATLKFDDEDWAAMKVKFVPGLAIRPLRSTAIGIWNALSNGSKPPAEMLLDQPAALLVWREDLSPVFRSTSVAEAEYLERMREGMTFGSLCECLAIGRDAGQAAAEAGTLLGRWIGEGLIAEATAGPD